MGPDTYCTKSVAKLIKPFNFSKQWPGGERHPLPGAEHQVKLVARVKLYTTHNKQVEWWKMQLDVDMSPPAFVGTLLKDLHMHRWAQKSISRRLNYRWYWTTHDFLYIATTGGSYSEHAKWCFYHSPCVWFREVVALGHSAWSCLVTWPIWLVRWQSTVKDRCPSVFALQTESLDLQT